MATASAPTRPRRRPRSSRLVRAAALLAVAAVVAVGAVLVVISSGGDTRWPVAAGLVVLALAAAATRSTHLEVLAVRRDGGADRARLAKEYRTITDERVAENTDFTATMRRRLEDRERVAAEQLATIRAHETALDRRERRLAAVESELREVKDHLAGTEQLARAQSARADDLDARLRDAEAGAATKAAEVALRIADLETERDALRSELHLWQDPTPHRRQA